MDDFLLWLLVYKIHPSPASTPFGSLGNLKVSSSSTGLQWMVESTCNSSTVQFIPEAGDTEDDKVDEPSPHSANASKLAFTSSIGIQGLPSCRFAGWTSLSLPSSNPNAVKMNLISSSDKFSSLSISESSISEEKPGYADLKHADSSKKGFTHRRPERRHQARIIGKTRKLVNLTNRILESTGSTMLDSNCSLPKPDKTIVLESSQTFTTRNFSFHAGSFATSSFSMSIVNATSSLSHAANADACASISSSKSSSDACLKTDCSVAEIPYILGRFLSRGKDLKVQLQYWKNWARHKVMQATNRLNQDKAELQTLRKEKLEATTEKEAFADSTMKKVGEMDKALSGERTEVEVASADICKLEFEKVRLEQELAAAKIRASESAANSREASLKEAVTLKKAQACERERTLFQEELGTEKRVLSQLQQQLKKLRRLMANLRWKQQERLKSEELTRAFNERKQHEQLEASAKSKEEMVISKNESNMQSCIDHIKKLRHQTAELKLMIESSNFARLDWAKSAYFTADMMGFKGSGGREVQREWECVMCLAEEISVVFLPCAHQVLCTKCNELHEKQGLGDCPSCRTPIKQRICIRSVDDI